MFSKSSVFAVVALAAFLSLGALLLPQIVQAQDCVWDCDLGSGDGSFNPWGNSPNSQLDIAYCLDRDCVASLKAKNGSLIFTTSIPVPLVQHHASPCLTVSLSPLVKQQDVTISGTVVALLRDNQGNLQPESAARASLFLKILKVNCLNAPDVLSRVVTANESRTEVFDATSNITILTPTSSTPLSLSTPIGWTGCPGANKKGGILTGNCPFPLGIVEFTAAQLQNELPATARFGVGEVYRAELAGPISPRFVGVRDCKGDPLGDSTTIACSTGGGESLAVFAFPGNWSGAQNHTINPNSGNNPFDIVTSQFSNLDAATIMATANDGPQVPTTGCFAQNNQQTLRCFFNAAQLLPSGCTKNQPVLVLVTGNFLTPVFGGFQSHDTPTCAK